MGKYTSYDFIVVGAGSAGCVLAGRLAADPSKTVLVIEAGLDWPDGELPFEFRNTRGYYKWDIDKEIPRSWAKLTAKRTDTQHTDRYIRGKGYGGSSVINGACILRPPLEEFDDWVKLGLTKWGRDAVLPAFIDIENDLEYGYEDYHGTSGGLPINRVAETDWGDMDHTMLAAALHRGHRWERNLHRPGAFGASICPQNIVNNERITTADAFIGDRTSRPNLHFMFETLVDTVEFDGQKAVGVRVLHDGATESIRCGEVILTAGAVHSAMILQRSGIGPSDLLTAHGIPIRKALPVGQHMQDHAGIEISTLSREPMRQPAVGSKRGNVLVRFSSGLAGAGDLAIKALNVDEDLVSASVLVSLEQVFSYGTVNISSRTPEDPPQIHFNLLSDPRDAERMRYLYRHALSIFASDPWRSKIVNEKLGGKSLPPQDTSDQVLDDWLQRHIRDTAHMTSSCRMGAPGDSKAVLDQECRVLGFTGLRVADASSLPTTCRANAHLTVLMLAWRVAEFIGEDKQRSNYARSN